MEAYSPPVPGSTIVGQSTSDDFVFHEAFRMNSTDGMVGLGSATAWKRASSALGVSADGSAIVGYSTRITQYDAFLWTEDDGMLLLPKFADATEVVSEAWDISADGSTVVGIGATTNSSGEPTQQPFRYEVGASEIIGLGQLPGGSGYGKATAVSANGSVIAGVSNSTAFVWDEANGMRGLLEILSDAGVDVAGWSLTSVTGISNDGTVIVGGGHGPDTPDYRSEGWIAVIPEPATAPLILIARRSH